MKWACGCEGEKHAIICPHSPDFDLRGRGAPKDETPEEMPCEFCGAWKDLKHDPTCPRFNEPSPGNGRPTVAGGASTRQVGGDYYKTAGVQPWDVVDTWPREQRIGYYRGGALKYIMRMGAKDESTQEIAKGQHYLEKLLEVLKGA